MRLLLVATEFPPGPGGIGTHACQVAHHLTRRGWQVAVSSPQDYAEDAEIHAFNGVQPFPVTRLRPIPGPALEATYRLAALGRALARWSPDVALATGERASWLMAVLGGICGIPWVAVGHGAEFGVSIAWERSLNRWAFSQANAVVCVS